MSVRRLCIYAGLLCLVACLAAGRGLAQTTGNIEGTVVDSTNVTLPGVAIEVKSPSLQGVRTAVSDSAGRFRISAVSPGTYTVTANLSGFRKVQRTAVVSLDSTAIVPFKLEMSMSQEVVVTGEAPVVDTSSTTAGTNYTTQQIAKLPLGRNYADVVRLQPGVQVDNGETQGRSLALSIYGSTSAENLWLIDGVNTTNVIKGFQGKSINAEFVEEVEVKTGGYQAEYGRNTGGVINVITKQGGNEFHGGIFGYWNNASSQAALHNEQTAPYSQSGDVAATTSTPRDTRLEGGASLGGFFVKDRLWFFGAYDKIKRDVNIEPQAGVRAHELFPYSEDSNLYSAKLTAKITDSTELQLSLTSDPQTNEGALLVPNSFNPNTYNASRDMGGDDYAVRLSQLAGNWGLLNLQYARHSDKFMTNVASVSRVTDNTDAVINGNPATIFGGYGNVFGPTINNESKRDSILGSMSFFVGSHQIKVGGDYQKDLTSGSTYRSGGSGMVIYPCIAGRSNYDCDLSKAPFADTAAGRIQVFYDHLYYAANGTDLTPLAASPFATPSKAWSGYVQDDWKVLPNLSVNAGLRYDRQMVYKGDDTVALDLKDQFAPRLGFSWDFLNNGSSKLYASAGRFYYATPTDLNVRVFTANTSVQAYNYSPTDLLQLTGAPRRLTIQIGSVAGEPVDAGIKQAYQDEFTIGVEKAIDSTFSLGAKFTYRTLGRTIEDRCDLDYNDPLTQYNSCAIFNPGGNGPAARGALPTCNGSENPTDPQAGECGLPGIAVPDAKRIYRGFELTARKRMGESVWVQASYLYSLLTGNYSGAIRTGSGQTDPGINADYDYYQFLQNATGPLELDRPHSLRVDGSYSTPFGLLAGLGFHIRSGVPISKQGYFNVQYPQELFLSPRGSEGRTPTDWDADLQIAYAYKFGPVTITPQLFLLNVFNRQTPWAYDQRFNLNGSFVTNKNSPYYGQAGIEPGTTANCPASSSGPCTDNPNYMKVYQGGFGRTGYRTLRAAIKVSF